MLHLTLKLVANGLPPNVDVPLNIRSEDAPLGLMFPRGITIGQHFIQPELVASSSPSDDAPIFSYAEYQNAVRDAVFAAWVKRYDAAALLSGAITFSQFVRDNKIEEPEKVEPWLPPNVRKGTPAIQKHALDFDEADLPKDKFIAWPCVEVPYYCMIGAPGGVGKSSWLLGLAIRIAAGHTSWGNVLIRERCPVLIINMDDTRAKQQKRLVAAMASSGIAAHEVGDRLHIWTPDFSKLIAAGGGEEITATAFETALDAKLAELKPGLLILDPLVRFHSADENQNTAMSEVTEKLLALLKKHNCACIIAHHPPKGHFTADDDMFRGASVLATNARSTLFLLPGSAEGTIQVVHGKHSYTEVMEPASFKFVSHELSNGDTSASLVPTALGDPLEYAEAVLQMIADGRSGDGHPWAVSQYAKKEHRLALAVEAAFGAGTASQILPALQEAGIICQQKVKPDKKEYLAWIVPA